MPQYKIIKERTHLFAPNINVAISFDIIRSGKEKEMEKESGSGADHTDDFILDQWLEAAIAEAIKANEILNCRIILSDNGDAFYETLQSPVISICHVEDSFEEIVCRQQNILFDLEHGELIRFFIKKIDNGSRIYIVTHHLAGDGLSMTHLVDDILRALSGEKLAFRPVELFSLDSLPNDSRLGGMMRFMMGRINRKWKKTGQVFTFDDYRRMFAKYWENREAEIFTRQISRDKMDSILSETKNNNITFNSVLTTAVLQAVGKPADLGMAVDIRQNGYAGMGNFTSGISIQYAYDDTKDFWENARKVHTLIYAKLDNNAKKYFLNRFMGALEPTLIDAAYFSAFDRYQNKTAQTIAQMFGYDGHPKGISMTNLAKVPVASAYSSISSAYPSKSSAYSSNAAVLSTGCSYSVENFFVVPPLVPNAKRIFGIATQGGVLSMTLHVAKDEHVGEEKVLFEKAVAILLSLG